MGPGQRYITEDSPAQLRSEDSNPRSQDQESRALPLFRQPLDTDLDADDEVPGRVGDRLNGHSGKLLDRASRKKLVGASVLEPQSHQRAFDHAAKPGKAEKASKIRPWLPLSTCDQCFKTFLGVNSENLYFSQKFEFHYSKFNGQRFYQTYLIGGKLI